MRSDRDVIAQQMKEGAALAPGAGRVLRVPVSEGSVVLPGETIATIAEDHYILRLQLPERHARFLRAGDVVKIGGRGLAEDGAKSEGRVRLVYPEIQGGRVIADVEAPGIGDYFVGERTRVYVSTGEREAILVPRDLVYRRAGVDFVKAKDGAEVVVQLGVGDDRSVEILAGLKDGDEIVTP
jgi:multidrug efflux pump subunit AcrA (membrane-fusion protein)